MHRSWLIFVCAVAATAASCSRAVTPTLDDANLQEASATAGRPGSEPRSFRARLVFEGPTVTTDRMGHPLLRRKTTYYVYSREDVGARIDTIPANSSFVRVDWMVGRQHNEGTASSAGAERVTFHSPTVKETSQPAGAGPFLVGLHGAQADHPKGADGPVAHFAFFVGFRPSLWWAGPDVSRWPDSSDGLGRGVMVTDWAQLVTVPQLPVDGRAWFGRDSFAFVPRERLPLRGTSERRSFYEISGDRIYARTEGDTVFHGSWIVLCNGGFDRDSPYTPRVVAGDPALPPGYAGDLVHFSLLNSQGQIGSPISFRHQVAVRRPDGTMVQQARSSAYPNFDPGSVFRNPQVFGYVRPIEAGKYYVQAVSEDADGLLSPSTLDFAGLADRVDAGGGTVAERAARRSILTFYLRQPER